MGRRLAQLDALDVTELKGVGAKTAESLTRLGVRTVLDVLMYYPRRYVDRTNQASIAEVSPGDEVVLIATVRSGRAVRSRNGREFVVITVTDDSGAMDITFFNQRWRIKQLPAGTSVALFGKVEDFRGRIGMTNPLVDRLGTRVGRIVPIYPQSDKERIDSDTIGEQEGRARVGFAAQIVERVHVTGSDRAAACGLTDHLILLIVVNEESETLSAEI